MTDFKQTVQKLLGLLMIIIAKFLAIFIYGWTFHVYGIVWGSKYFSETEIHIFMLTGLESWYAIGLAVGMIVTTLKTVQFDVEKQ